MEPSAPHNTSHALRPRGRFIRIALYTATVCFLLIATQDYWRPLMSTVPEDATSSKRGTAGRGVPVIPANVDLARDTVVITAIGTARAAKSVTLFAEAEGEVIALQVPAGAPVAKNDVILRLDNRAQSLAVQVAETHVKAAQNELNRALKLKQSNVRSAANVEDAEVALERAKLELSQALEERSNRTLRAPFTGIVGIPKVEVGDRITTDTDVASMDDRTTLLVEVEVAESYFGRLRIGMPVSARTPTSGNQAINGVIEKIDSRIDPVARTVLIRAAFPNERDSLRPGMSFTVDINLSGQQRPSVPELALQWQNGQSFVWRLIDGRAERVNVTITRRLNEMVLVEGDLLPGEQVAVEGVQRLRNGIQVFIPEQLQNN